MNQKGIAPLLILVVFAAVIGVGAVAYGYFIATSPTDPKSEIPSMEDATRQIQVPVGTPECPELDYTGCDTSQDWMTWSDDGVR